ncbi:MAG: YihY/virulence factor BrkB family protein [Chloroflexota bacterium]|nr:YihY/virulence factor BrkB family protein [Chloroflexota bacterium]
MLKQTFTEWNEDKVPRLAAALSYYIAFSLAPLLVLTIAVVGFILREQMVREEVLELVTGTVGAQAGELVGELIDNLRQPASGILSTVLGIAALLFGAIGVFEQLKDALNTVWGVPAKEAPSGVRGFIFGKLISFSMVLVIGLLLLVSLVISTLLNAFNSYTESLFPGAPALLQIVNTLVSFGLVVVLFALVYRILPDIKLEWRDVWIGAAITALLFTIGKFALSFYLGNTGTASLYGAAGSFVLILLWIYYSAQIILFGAEFTQVYARRYGSLRHQSDKQAVVPDAS